MKLDHSLIGKVRMYNGSPCYEVVRVYHLTHWNRLEWEIRYIDGGDFGAFHFHVIVEDMSHET